MATSTEADKYTAAFYDNVNETSVSSASSVVPFVLGLFPHIKSAVDIGCGAGAWLSVFEKYRISVQGYDFGRGAREKLLIAPEKYHEVDLSLSIPVEPGGGRYDLAICLEVGEHMDASASDTLVNTVTSLSNIVMFSAAIPAQPGTNHINCQWPIYWADKFAAKGYRCFDILRPVFWQAPTVSEWYRQNLMLMINIDAISDENTILDIKRLERFTDFKCAPLVHPKWHGLIE